MLKDLRDKTIILGVIDLSDHEVEPADTVADRVRRAFPFTPPDRVAIAPDCGMKYLPRASAEGKMRAMAGAAAMLRAAADSHPGRPPDRHRDPSGTQQPRSISPTAIGTRSSTDKG